MFLNYIILLFNEIQTKLRQQKFKILYENIKIYII